MADSKQAMDMEAKKGGREERREEGEGAEGRREREYHNWKADLQTQMK